MSVTVKNRSYEDLQVWQKSIDLAVHIYEMTKNFPSDEKYGLISQMRRSANSISSNIAEGCSRDGLSEFQHFLSIAQGSLAELKTQIIISQRIKLLKEEKYTIEGAKKRLNESYEGTNQEIDQTKTLISEIRNEITEALRLLNNDKS